MGHMKEQDSERQRTVSPQGRKVPLKTHITPEAKALLRAIALRRRVNMTVALELIITETADRLQITLEETT